MVESMLLKLLGVFGGLASILEFALYIIEHTSHMPPRTGWAGLNVVLHLTVLTAICYGLLWIALEKLFGLDFGAGGRGVVPAGRDAVVLSLSMNLPLVVVPALYQLMTGVIVLAPRHWKAISLEAVA